MQPPPQVVTQRLKRPRPLCFTGDGRKIVCGASSVSAWRLPDLERAFQVRPLPQPQVFVTQPTGSAILCANHLAQFALLDGETGQTVAICADEPYISEALLALSACGRFVIYGWRDRVRVREIATDRVCWERRIDRGEVNGIQPMLDGHVWVFQISTRPLQKFAPRSQHLEFWSWPFGAEPLRVLLLPQGMYVAAVSRTGRIASTGSPRPGTSAVQVYAEDSGELLVERAVHYLDRVIGWIDDDHFALGDDEGVQIRNATTADLVRRIELPGADRYGCTFSPNGADLTVSYWEKGFAYLRGICADGRAEVRIENPWGAPKPRRAAERAALDHWYSMPRVERCRAIAGETLAHLKEQLPEFRREAWQPETAADDGVVTASKFGGTPFIASPGEWPRCGVCADRLQLALQLRAADLPAELHDLFAGTLQAFFCTTEACGSYQPFEPTTVVRIVDTTKGTPAYGAPPFDEAYIGRRIVGWQKTVDYPTAEELELLGVRLADGPEVGSDLFCPLTSDKLMGWPNWPQDPAYVKCPRCSKAMRAIVQIGSEDNIPFMFGDAGTAWLAQCSEHRDVLTFYYRG